MPATWPWPRWPPPLPGYGLQLRRGINHKRITSDFQHVGIPDGIAENRVRAPSNYFVDGLGLAFAAGHADHPVGNFSALDHGGRSNDPVSRDVEVPHTRLNPPIAGGGYGPDFASQIVQSEHQLLHFREDLAGHVFVEILP